MKRLIFSLKLLFAALPMIIYIVCFIKYEPYNYFGLQEEARSASAPLTLLREFIKNPSGNIILGDSRMNHVDLELAEELTGEKWCLLATGGQGASMTYALYEWAKTKINIQNVIVDISFYQLTDGKVSTEIAPLVYIAEHPLEYIVTRDYVMETFSLWRAMQQGGMGSITKEENKKQKNTSKYRDDLVEYALNNIYPSCIDYTVNEEQKEYLISVIKDVWEGGGTARVLIPVVQESIWEYVIIPLNIEPHMEEYKSEAEKYAIVYDMEWMSELSKQQDIFADGFHFRDEETYQIYTRNLLGDAGEYVKIRNNRQNTESR